MPFSLSIVHWTLNFPSSAGCCPNYLMRHVGFNCRSLGCRNPDYHHHLLHQSELPSHRCRNHLDQLAFRRRQLWNRVEVGDCLTISGSSFLSFSLILAHFHQHGWSHRHTGYHIDHPSASSFWTAYTCRRRGGYNSTWPSWATSYFHPSFLITSSET